MQARGLADMRMGMQGILSTHPTGIHVRDDMIEIAQIQVQMNHLKHRSCGQRWEGSGFDFYRAAESASIEEVHATEGTRCIRGELQRTQN